MIGRVSMNFHSIHVDFSGIDFPVASELALSLQTMLELYPDMEASIVAIGNSDFLLRYFSRMQEGKKSTWRKIKEIQESIQSSRTDMKNPMTIYHWREGKKNKIYGSDCRKLSLWRIEGTLSKKQKTQEATTGR